MDHERLPTDAPELEEARVLSELTGLAEVASETTPGTVERVLIAARETLGMDVAFVSEFADGKQIYRFLDGDATYFGLREGEGMPLDGTFCRRLIAGQLPNVIPDLGKDDRVRNLASAREAGIGAYVGVPLRFSDG